MTARRANAIHARLVQARNVDNRISRGHSKRILRKRREEINVLCVSRIPNAVHRARRTREKNEKRLLR